jgi:N-acyl-D-aspartate/D-glutamate deacylase
MDRGLRSKRRSDTAARPLDVLFDVLVESGGSVSTVYAHHMETDMNLALTQPWCSIGSDGSALATEGPLRQGNPHPRSFGTFPRVLGVYVRERGVLPLEDAIRKMTSLNASKIGRVDRGLLRPGAFADVAVFDGLESSTGQPEPLPIQRGYRYLIVNGRSCSIAVGIPALGPDGRYVT